MVESYKNKIEFVKNPDSRTLRELTGLLEENGLIYENGLDETLLIRREGSLIGTGSISGNVLKCIAVKEGFKNTNSSGDIITNLINREYQKGRTELFLFTKPENKKIFARLGFFPVYEIKENIVLMENNPSGLENFLEGLKRDCGNIRRAEGKISSIVVNCNPITNGHMYLIEKAVSLSAVLHLFVVSEDRSVFPFDVRYRLIKEATASIKNLIIHKGGDYIISNATFPSYFIKESKQIVNLHAQLDLELFSEKIAPALGITARFAGDEPLCPVTANYNRYMNEILPEHGIEFHIIKRFETEGEPVSASMVRKYLVERNFEGIKKIVPSSTYNFLISAEGEEIIKKLEKVKR